MTFLPVPSRDELSEDARAVGEPISGPQAAPGGPIDAARGALLGHVPSFTAYMEWFTLKEELVPYIGERAFALFCYAISEEADCAGCIAFFRRVLIESGNDIENPQVTETERLLVDWGTVIARAPGEIPDEMYARLERAFSPKLRLMLVAFAGQMVAATVFTIVGRVPMDEALLEFRRPGDTRTAG